MEEIPPGGEEEGGSSVLPVQRKKAVWMKIQMGLLNTQNETTEESRTHKIKHSCIDATALLSPVSHLAQCCTTQPEVRSDGF